MVVLDATHTPIKLPAICYAQRLIFKFWSGGRQRYNKHLFTQCMNDAEAILSFAVNNKLPEHSS